MHRFDLYVRNWLNDAKIAGVSPTYTYDATGTSGNYRYAWHVPAAKADTFRAALRAAIDQHNQHFNTPRLTVFETIGWGFSQD
jgi:hypothetical protein